MHVVVMLVVECSCGGGSLLFAAVRNRLLGWQQQEGDSTQQQQRVPAVWCRLIAGSFSYCSCVARWFQVRSSSGIALVCLQILQL